MPEFVQQLKEVARTQTHRKNQKTVWRHTHKEAVSIHSHRTYIKRTFGISAEEYKERLVIQGDNCALCGEAFYGEPGSLGSPVLDHNHLTGVLREFLHKKCNAALGLFGDCLEICKASVDYLEKHSGD